MWAPGERAGTVTATWHFGDDTETAELRVGEDGPAAGGGSGPVGQSGRRPFRRCPFGVAVEAEATFSGITIPSQFRAGWWWCTDRQAEGEFFRAVSTIAGGAPWAA
jgi:hypothetical protein